MVNLFKSIFKGIFNPMRGHRQSIGVVFYPERILFETYHQIKHSYQIRSDEVSFLERQAPDHEIGKTILKHLALSKNGINNPGAESYKKSQDTYKKITGLKSIKAQMKNAQYVFVDKQNNRIIFTPSINGGSSGNDRGYRPITDEIVEISDAENFETIGRALNDALQKCKTI